MIISIKKVKVLVTLLCLTVCNLMDYIASQSPLYMHKKFLTTFDNHL